MTATVARTGSLAPAPPAPGPAAGAAYGGERVRVVRRGREIAAIVPIEDVELLERLEDELDLKAALEALTDPENAVPIPWEQVKAELGL